MTLDVPTPMPSPTLDVLRYAGVPEGQAGDRLGRLVVLLAQRYGLAPELGHVEVIRTRNGPKVYITRDGWLDIAHRSGVLDGIVTVDEWADDEGWKATISVYRRDMAHPFTYGACYRRAEQASDNNDDPASKALARAERRALKRAFRVPIVVAERELMADDDADAPEPEPDAVSRDTAAGSAETPAVAAGTAEPLPPRVLDAARAPVNDRERQAAAHRLVGSLTEAERTAFLMRHGIDTFGEAWPEQALIDAARSAVSES